MSNKIAVIVGGSGGIGSKIVETLLMNNYFVINIDKIAFKKIEKI